MTQRLGMINKASLRVAFTAVAATACMLIAASVVIDLWVQHSIIGDVDTRLTRRLTNINNRVAGQNAEPAGLSQEEQQVIDVPLAIWVYDGNGTLVAKTPMTPTLPQSMWQVEEPTSINLSGTDFRVDGQAINGARVVTGQSLSVANEDLNKLITTELVVVPVLLIAVFLGALSVGRRAARPIEEARQRQLAFTADASHELRTPLSVIEAESALALGKARKPVEYRESLERISDESGRLREIVDALLWLARFDSEPSPPAAEEIDLCSVAESARDRFAPVAARKNLSLKVTSELDTALILAPPEWIDRLVGVLLDNACKYTPEDGSVVATVFEQKGRIALSVEDSGPGVPVAERATIFDRFRRATQSGSGAGLGLAIGNAVVSASGGSWEIGAAGLGGARFVVSWPKA